MPDHPSSPESPISASPPVTVSAPIPTQPLAASRTNHRRFAILLIVAIIVIVLLILAIPWLIQSFTTVSTDDAYVNGHVTFVAPRVAGQVSRVLVEDNNRVHKGDLLVQLDKEPFQVQVNIAAAAVAAAQADLKSAQAQTRALEGQARSQRFALEHAVEDVDNQIALLHAKVATLESQKATLTKAQDDYERALPLVQSGGVTKEELDRRKEVMLVSQADVEQALQGVYQVRVSLGLPPKPPSSTTLPATTQPPSQPTADDLTQVPPDLDQSFSAVRQAQYALMQAAAQLGVFQPVNVTPKEMIAEFYKRDPTGDIEKIYAQILLDAPAVKQAEAKLAEARRNLDQANLNLKYCDIVSEIDGVVTRRDVNPGNNIIVGQSLMAVRSLSEIWIDANFKETQLRDLKIGQRADIDADMYGSRKRFEGRITGFTMGTGSTLALLPAENATGNFVKVVQRLPVRIELTDYDPDKDPLFIGLSVTPIVHVNEEPSGPNAGQKLQPYMAMEKASTTIPTTVP